MTLEHAYKSIEPASSRALRIFEIVDLIILHLHIDSRFASKADWESSSNVDVPGVSKLWQTAFDDSLGRILVDKKGLLQVWDTHYPVRRILAKGPSSLTLVKGLQFSKSDHNSWKNAKEVHDRAILAACRDQLQSLTVYEDAFLDLSDYFYQDPILRLKNLKRLSVEIPCLLRHGKGSKTMPSIRHFLRSLQGLSDIILRIHPFHCHESRRRVIACTCQMGIMLSMPLGSVHSVSIQLKADCVALEGRRQLAELLQHFVPYPALDLVLQEAQNLDKVLPPCIETLRVYCRRVTVDAVLAILADPQQLPQLRDLCVSSDESTSWNASPDQWIQATRPVDRALVDAAVVGLRARAAGTLLEDSITRLYTTLRPGQRLAQGHLIVGSAEPAESEFEYEEWAEEEEEEEAEEADEAEEEEKTGLDANSAESGLAPS